LRSKLLQVGQYRSHQGTRKPSLDVAPTTLLYTYTIMIADATRTLRLRGKAIMPDLGKLMRHRIDLKLKQTTVRSNKDQETTTTSPGVAAATAAAAAALSKQQGKVVVLCVK